MTFSEAKKRLKEMAGTKIHCLEYSEFTHSDGEAKPRCQLYIAEVGHTDHQINWDLAFIQLGMMMKGEPKENQAPVEEVA